ncbi:MAG: hypothetical protein ACLTMP_14890 [Eggerthella lenta]
MQHGYRHRAGDSLKRTTDRLSIVASSATVLREARGRAAARPAGARRRHRAGAWRPDPADAEVVSGVRREREPAHRREQLVKRPGDELMSGSFVNAGVLALVVRGRREHAAKISAEAKQHKTANRDHEHHPVRQLQSSPLGALLFARQHFLGGVESTAASYPRCRRSWAIRGAHPARHGAGRVRCVWRSRRCSCSSCTASRRWHAWTRCASTRRAPSPQARWRWRQCVR